MHVIAGKAMVFGEALTPEFRTYQKRVVANADRLVQQLQSHGLRLFNFSAMDELAQIIAGTVLGTQDIFSLLAKVERLARKFPLLAERRLYRS